VPLVFRRFAVVLFALVTLAADRHARGVVFDVSNGVLPGVTVTASAPDGRVLATAVTDGAGRYAIGPLAPGPATLTFQLNGFATATIPITMSAEADTIVSPQLAVAPQSETVDVVGKVPIPLPSPPSPPPPRPRPRPVTTPVPDHDPESVCGPARVGAMPESFGILRTRRTAGNGLYSEGDELDVDGGTRNGLAVGRNYAVRRTFRIEWDPGSDIGEHTSGLVQIVAAGEETAVAVVIYACDAMMPGDRLATFTPEPRRAAAPAGAPDYRYPARILFPDVGRLLGAPRQKMVIDRGSADGIRVGQRLTLFRRRSSGGRARTVVGEAIVVAVKFDSATIRVERVADAVMSGDWAAPQR
jgi:hypothetical protein